MRLIISVLISLLIHTCGNSSCPHEPVAPLERTGMEVGVEQGVSPWEAIWDGARSG